MFNGSNVSWSANIKRSTVVEWALDYCTEVSLECTSTLTGTPWEGLISRISPLMPPCLFSVILWFKVENLKFKIIAEPGMFIFTSDHRLHALITEITETSVSSVTANYARSYPRNQPGRYRAHLDRAIDHITTMFAVVDRPSSSPTSKPRSLSANALPDLLQTSP